MALSKPLSLYQLLQPQISELNEMCAEFTRLLEQDRKAHCDDLNFETRHRTLAFEESLCDITEICHISSNSRAPGTIRLRNDESVKRYCNFTERCAEITLRRERQVLREEEIAEKKELILSVVLDVELSMDTAICFVGDVLHAARVLIGVQPARVLLKAPRRAVRRVPGCRYKGLGVVGVRKAGRPRKYSGSVELFGVSGRKVDKMKAGGSQISVKDSGEISSVEAVVDEGRSSVITFSSRPVEAGGVIMVDAARRREGCSDNPIDITEDS